MINISKTLIELFIGCVICGIFAAIVLIIKHFSDKKELELFSSFPQNVVYEIENSEILIYNENPNFLLTKSYIYDVVDEGNRFKIKLFFHHAPEPYAKTGNQTDFLYMDKNAFYQMGLQKGMIVNTLHNAAPEYQYKAAKII